MRFLRVAIDVPIPRLFDYIAPETDDAIERGMRVLVPFGARQQVGLIVDVLAETAISASKLKRARDVLRDTPPLSSEWLGLVQFCSDYYHRPLGEVALSAMPPRLRRPEPLQRGVDAWQITALGRESFAKARNRLGDDKRAILDFLLTHASGLHDELIARIAQGTGAIRDLARRGWIVMAERSAPDWRFVERTPISHQVVAIDAIAASSDRFTAFVLHGITGSGKTEVYLHAIHRVVQAGHQALVLVPEINLTPQLAHEFRSRFPGLPIVILHSGLAANERALAWLDAQTGQARIVLGTRMGVFTPFKDLRLIVVDEEHDTSFKQQDGVRYSARDLAVFRARALNIPMVLGSATPSIETFANAESGRYRLLTLPERARDGALMPTIRLIDVRKDLPQHGIADALIAALRLRIERGEQSLVYLNRRGYAPVMACGACGWVADCTRCSAHQVVHMAVRGKQTSDAPRAAHLRCHHCGLVSPPPRACPTCGNVDLAAFGRGTQRLEDTIVDLFPSARILRIDSDSTRNKGSWESMRNSIANDEVDILIGTQILAKGHDFPRLTLVGVLNADASLMAGDYRAPERLFSQLQQVAGRAGRAALHGEVLIQTRYPHAALYQSLVRNDFRGFAQQQLAERTSAGFPPSTAEAVLRAEAHEIEIANQFLRAAVLVAPADRESVSVFDPVPMTLTRLSGWERAHVLMQSGSRRALQNFIGEWVTSLHALPAQRDLRWHIDVDPLEF
ncbi:MAG: primosomal protein N' [Betaproteobacteria bacterium]|nr:primosomal protein N' [Betaproteobacteria bacterium]